MEKYLDDTMSFETFDSDVFRNMVERIKVINKHKIEIEFKCGFEYEMDI